MTFNRELLAVPGQFYEQELGKLSRPSRGWAKANCPFHPSKSKTSFSINLNSGGFFCHGCGVKGGDVLSFVMQRDSVDFKTACKSLGYWNDGKRSIKVQPGPLVPYLVMDFTIDGIQYRAQIEDELKTELQQLQRFHHAAADRLIELRNGGAEQFEGEEETQWGILAASWELIQMELADVT